MKQQRDKVLEKVRTPEVLRLSDEVVEAAKAYNAISKYNLLRKEEKETLRVRLAELKEQLRSAVTSAQHS